MKAEVPQYVIRYLQCSQPDHEGQKINLICLSKACSDQSLICSMCNATKHKNHDCKPIKIYLDQLYKRYKINNSNINSEIEELQKRKIMMLLNLKTCVQRIADQFSKLQDDIIRTYQQIKSQIYQNEHKRNRFEEFYLSMIKDNYGDPNFQIKNFLYKEEVQLFTDQDIFSSISQKLTKEITNVRSLFLQEDSHVSEIGIGNHEQINNNQLNKSAFILPYCIKQQTDVFSQTIFSINSQNLCLFDLQLSQWVSKLRITILQYLPGSKLTFGVIKKQQYVKANYIFKEGLNCQYLDSTGKSKGSQSNYITTLGLNMIIDFFVKKNNFRAICKNSNTIFNLSDKNAYFFFAIEGKTKIKITYPYNK